MRCSILLVVSLLISRFLFAVEKEPLNEESRAFIEKLPLMNEPPLSFTLPEVDSNQGRISSAPIIRRFKTQLRRSSAVKKRVSKVMTLKKKSGRPRLDKISPPKLEEKEVITVGEMIASLIPEALKNEGDPIAFFEDQEDSTQGSIPSLSERITSERPVAESGPKPAPKVPDKTQGQVTKKISLVMTGIGLVGLFGFGLALAVGYLRPRRKKTESFQKLGRDLIEDPRSDLIYQGWWHDDIKEIQRMHKETIKNLDEKVENRIITIENNQNRLSQALNKIEEKLERINSLVNRFSSGPDGVKAGLNPSHERVIRLSKNGLNLEEIARTTRMGKGEVELILKSQNKRLVAK